MPKSHILLYDGLMFLESDGTERYKSPNSHYVEDFGTFVTMNTDQHERISAVKKKRPVESVL
jgi:hypothetical protein